SVEIHIVQGERPMASDNKSLGRFILDGIPPAPRGIPQIEVSFDVDANGILNVKAKDKASGKEQSIRIEASSGLSEEDIKKMKDEAEAHAEEDKKKKELADEKNTADMIIFTAEKSLKDYGDKVGDEVKKSIEEKIAKVKTAKDGQDISLIKSSIEELTAELSKIGEAMNKEAGAGQGEPSQGEAKEDNIKDAEVKEEGGEQK
ncbi:MAG: molecular chaperone DnaK, partial [Candidatus Moranbacteria bacterium]|nr:molecular chaperone DnaK [Candidatus Moranbacteria bacterium]